MLLSVTFNPIQTGAAHGCEIKRAPTSDTYPPVMKLGSYTLPKKNPKNI